MKYRSILLARLGVQTSFFFLFLFLWIRDCLLFFIRMSEEFRDYWFNCLHTRANHDGKHVSLINPIARKATRVGGSCFFLMHRGTKAVALLIFPITAAGYGHYRRCNLLLRLLCRRTCGWWPQSSIVHWQFGGEKGGVKRTVEKRESCDSGGFNYFHARNVVWRKKKKTWKIDEIRALVSRDVFFGDRRLYSVVPAPRNSPGDALHSLRTTSASNT